MLPTDVRTSPLATSREASQEFAQAHAPYALPSAAHVFVPDAPPSHVHDAVEFGAQVVPHAHSPKPDRSALQACCPFPPAAHAHARVSSTAHANVASHTHAPNAEL